MAYGGPAGDPQVTADLNTMRIWQRRLDAGRLDLDYRPKTGPNWLLGQMGARPDFEGLEAGLGTQRFRHLEKVSRVDDRSPSAVNAALGGVGRETWTHSAFALGDLCARCKEEVEDIPHHVPLSSLP
eukprot:166127-Amphidinium_carterae.1